MLLDLLAEHCGGYGSRWLPPPLTPEEIGAFIGFTSVHLSRTFALLEKRGEVERRGNMFRFCAINDMRRKLSYHQFN